MRFDVVPVGSEISPGVTSQFSCDLVETATRVAVLRDAVDRIVDCVALSNDAAGLLAGDYPEATQSGAWDALGVNASNCRVVEPTGG